MFDPKDVTPDQLVEIAEEHMNRFRGLIKAAEEGREGIRVGECEMYLRIWMSIDQKAREKGKNKSKDPAFDWLSLEEQNEVTDAVTSGDYDDILEPKTVN